MLRRTFPQAFVLILVLLAFLAIPSRAQAGGLCGGLYTVEAGETLEKIAAICGTSVSAITAANPGISGSPIAGQVITVPGTNYVPGSVPPGGTSTAIPNPPAPVSSGSVYVVRAGDTFSGIASRFGVSINALWAANPYIWNINYIFVGQSLRIPTSTGSVPGQIFPETPAHLSYGTVPARAPRANVLLSNQANADVYVSLQGETREGFDVINEYTVHGTMSVRIPAGWYLYVAWVGGRKFVGEFNLPGDSDKSITFYKNKVVVE